MEHGEQYDIREIHPHPDVAHPCVYCAQGLVVVPQQAAYIVERFGKFQKIMDPGLNFLIPLVHRIPYVYSLKEEALSVPSQVRSAELTVASGMGSLPPEHTGGRPYVPARSSHVQPPPLLAPAQTAITRDNVTLSIDGVLYVKVVDPYKAAYGVEDPHFAITQLAQTTMRSEIGKISLDNTFKERETLNVNIVKAINAAALEWGISCMRYEIRDISPPKAVRAAMELEAEAERRKRALVLDSEGEQEAEVNLARGRKMAAVLASEAMMQEHTNIGMGEAAAIEAKATANAAAIRVLAAAVVSQGGQTAMRLRVAEQYVSAFNSIAKEGNTVVVPANVGDAGAMVAQAMGIFKAMDGRGGGGGGSGGGGGGGGGGGAEELPADDMTSWRLAAEERAQLRPEGLEGEAKLDDV